MRGYHKGLEVVASLGAVASSVGSDCIAQLGDGFLLRPTVQSPCRCTGAAHLQTVSTRNAGAHPNARGQTARSRSLRDSPTQRRIVILTRIPATTDCFALTAPPGPHVVRYGEGEPAPQESGADKEKDPGSGTHRVTSSLLLCHLSAWKAKPSTMDSATAPPPSRMSPLAG